MKLVRFTKDTTDFVGAIFDNDRVVNINYLLDEPSLTMMDLIERGLGFIEHIESKLENINKSNDKELVAGLEDIVLKAPLPNPGKVVCVGLNYMDHCREQNVEPPESPLIFSKWPSSIIGPGGNIILPEESKQVDYEAELGVVIGNKGKHIAEENALDHVFGYVIVNDVSARDVQFADGQWIRGKSYDTFAPCGPYLVTADEVKDPHNLAIRCTVNGEVLQDSNTNEMIFNINEVVAYLSKGFTFKTGDLLSTGTPDGVGVFRNPKVFLEDGDEVVIEIEGLGVLKNTCVSERKCWFD
ncbi:fumarylacetoacetate hydrolase [Virgibacillus profundi]|uniref:Fumarylacetoacetate hydrolase n=1 Tax=Virgibacillus profundi TaxID=2024555 RepID=A0A2A2II33_9BACI|nr:fumarylacetoacetate hydrolase family protein [Virgibacillus profundi]PAV31202.1 fumarylacetoacetate hydrolase [Virgibacillus profundi]PXY55384.1 FAA hydrolase family protein [Virgibacillus profundi]